MEIIPLLIIFFLFLIASGNIVAIFQIFNKHVSTKDKMVYGYIFVFEIALLLIF